MKNGTVAKREVKAPPQTRRELRALLRGAVREIKAMSAEERFATMVRAGIYTKAGKLTKPYAG